MSRICILIGSIQTGGAEKQAILLAKVLSSVHDVTFFALNGNSYDTRLKNQLINQKTDFYLLKGFIIWRLFKLFRYIKTSKIDFLFCFLTSANLVGGILGRLLKIKHVYGSIRNSKLPFMKFVVQKYVHNNLTQYTIFNNYAGARNFAAKGYSIKKTIVIPNGIEILKPFTSREKRDHLTILTVARFVEQKDFKTALMAIKEIKSMEDMSESNLQYIILGYGPLEAQILNHIQNFNLSRCVKVITDSDNLPEYFLKADIYLSSSYFEGLPNTIMEAMSYGLPVVASDAGDTNRLVLENQSGYVVNAFDYHSMALRLKDLMGDHEKRIRFGLCGYNHCLENFSLQKFASNYLELIENSNHTEP